MCVARARRTLTRVPTALATPARDAAGPCAGVVVQPAEAGCTISHSFSLSRPSRRRPKNILALSNIPQKWSTKKNLLAKVPYSSSYILPTSPRPQLEARDCPA